MSLIAVVAGNLRDTEFYFSPILEKEKMEPISFVQERIRMGD